MVSKNETRVNYKATANFLSAVNAVRKLKKELADLRKEEAALNAQSIAGSAAVTAANLKKAKSSSTVKAAQADEAIIVDKLTGEVVDFAHSQDEAEKASARLTNTVKKAHAEQSKLGNVLDKSARSTRAAASEQTRFRSALSGSVPFVEKLHKQLDKIDDFRPHLIPPFIALIPVIGALLSLINPLVAVLGALGGAALGAGSSLASLAVSALGIVPALAAAGAGIAAILTSFKGIGAAFSAFSAAKKASGGGGGGGTGVSAADTLKAAESRYTNALIDEQQAQVRLTKARKDALRQLQDLQKAVDRAGADEADATAALMKAQEEYYNVFADTSSTAADKAQATADLTDAQNNLADVQQTNVRNQEDLTEAQAKGVEGDDQVVSSKQALTKAIEEENNALKDLQKAQSGATTGSGGGGGVNQFQAALDKLSPSAKQFVLTILSMSKAWGDLHRAVQEAFFSQFVGDLGLINKLLGPMQSLLTKAATSLGKFADNFLKLITSPDWLADFNTIGDNSASLLDDLGSEALSLLGVFKDLAIIAGPFALELSKGFKAGADNLAAIVANARKTGSLAKYLETIRQRLDQWWRIVKNVAKTLFNFGAASSDFGKWITDGLESMTANWLKVSQDARKNGSPFKTWLEDVKPLLKQIRGLFGDFFGWIGREASDPTNIKFATDLLKTVRDDLGPAISQLLDALTKSGISQSFVEALSAIVRSLSELVANGGASGFQSFMETLRDVFKVLADAFATPGLGVFLKGVATALGGLVALSFIGKFTGLTSLIGWLIKLGKAGKLSAILDKVGNLKNVAVSGATNAANLATGGSIALGGGTVDPKTGLATPTKGLTSGKKGPSKISKLSSAVGKSGVGSALKGGLIAGGVVLVASETSRVGDASVDEFTKMTEIINRKFKPSKDAKNNPKGLAEEKSAFKQKQVADLNKVGKASAYNAASGSLLPKLVGFLAGPKIEAIVADFMGTLNSNLYDLTTKTILPAIMTFFTKTLPDAWNGFISWIIQTWNGFIGWIKDTWNGFIGFIVDTWNGFISWIVQTWTGFVSWLQTVWNGFVGWLQGIWGGFVGWLQGIFNGIGSFFSGLVNNVSSWFKTAINNVGTWFNSTISSIGTWFQALPGTIAGYFTGIATTVAGKFSGIVGAVAAYFSGIGDKIAGFVKTALHNLHIPGFATGGSVAVNNPNKKPARSDTVAAMLTPGEFVMKKSAVDRIGAGNLSAMNNGMGMGKNMSFFASGGIVPNSTSAPSLRGGSTVVNNITINNPKREKSSDSLPGALRKVAYISNGRRKLDDRLTGVGDND